MKLECEPGEYTDSPTVWTGTIVFSRRSWLAMKDLIGHLGEVFELHGAASGFFLFNPLVNELVLSRRANVKRFDDGRLMFVLNPILRRDSAEGLIVGMLKEAPGSEVYVGQPFVDAWRRGGFVGLAFDPVPTAEE
ncbi:MAG: hypothetical protein H6721_04925 [Sandaracinus sp.]|nr:hypothetical protein [Sandaracinus sp.]MCB9631471.1 hypothetical protein [Sandaracinus sp.]